MCDGGVVPPFIDKCATTSTLIIDDSYGLCNHDTFHSLYVLLKLWENEVYGHIWPDGDPLASLNSFGYTVTLMLLKRNVYTFMFDIYPIYQT